jgi:subtilisin-like proprotein convertase family protein
VTFSPGCILSQYAPHDLPKRINELSGSITSKIFISEENFVTGVKVYLHLLRENISGIWVGLQGPMTPEYPLLSNNQCSGANIIAWFDFDSVYNASELCFPNGLNYSFPVRGMCSYYVKSNIVLTGNSMEAFNGTNSMGEWTLRVDYPIGQAGKLVDWRLQLNTLVCWDIIDDLESNDLQFNQVCIRHSTKYNDKLRSII